MSSQRDYDSTVARIAGNILSGNDRLFSWNREKQAYEVHAALIPAAVEAARAIVAETKRTQPEAGQTRGDRT